MKKWQTRIRDDDSKEFMTQDRLLFSTGVDAVKYALEQSYRMPYSEDANQIVVLRYGSIFWKEKWHEV